MSSPFKKFKSPNKSWIGYINISKLEPMKEYKVLRILTTKHESYGPGQEATIESSDGQKWRTQLPGKYLSSLSVEDVTILKKQTMEGNYPFLFFL